MKFLLIFLSLFFLITCDMSPENVLVAINCGGETYKDQRGIVYEADKYHNNKGEASDFGSNFEIKLTNDGPLYQTERWASEDLIYNLPLDQPGKYVLVLKFSEVYFNSPGEKVFDINLGHETVAKNMDIYTRVGKATAYDEYVTFEFKNNKVYLNNKAVEGAYDEENKTLSVIFKKTDRDNPKINAIVLVKGSLADTDYEYFKNGLEEYEKLQQEKERKQREFQKVSKDADFEDFEDDYIDTESGLQGKSAINTTTGMLILIGVVAFYFIYLKSNKAEE